MRLLQRRPRGLLHGHPRRPLPAKSLAHGVLPPRRVEGSSRMVGVTGQREVEVLARCPPRDEPDAVPAIEPAMDGDEDVKPAQEPIGRFRQGRTGDAWR